MPRNARESCGMRLLVKPSGSTGAFVKSGLAGLHRIENSENQAIGSVASEFQIRKPVHINKRAGGTRT